MYPFPQRAFDFIKDGRIINRRRHFVGFVIGDLDHRAAQDFARAVLGRR